MAKSVKPIKVPVILSQEALECGAVSLAMVLAYYGKWVPQSEVRTACGVSRDGSTALDIMKAARSYGLEVKAFRYTPDRVREAATFPSIVFWNYKHFVVLRGFKNGYAYINDPAEGEVRLPMEEFDSSYSNVCLTFQKGEAFQEGGKRPSTLGYLRAGLKGSIGLFALIMLTGALSSLAGTVVPVVSQVFTDYILPGDTPSWVPGFFTLFAAVILFQLLASVINTIYVTKATGKLAVTANASFMDHVLRMPMEFFAQRRTGDLSQRATSNDSVASTLVNQLSPTIMNLVLLVFYLVVMLQYSVPLTIVGVLTVIINLGLAKLISNKRTEITRTKTRDQGKLQSATVSGIDMVDTIKAAGAEAGYLEQWSGYHASMTKAQVKFDNVNRYLGTVPSLVQDLSSVIVMLMAFWLIMEGHLTAGMFLAFQSCMSSFMSPVNSLIGAGQSITEMKAQIERIADVADYPEDTVFNEDYDSAQLADAEKLAGRVELRDVSFGYSKLGDSVIKDFNLTIEPGKCVALVGSSGCGKSTIAKLLSGLYEPWSGQILFDGKPISDIPKPIFKGSVAMVDQEVTLFQDTIANNIRMWDATIDDHDVVLAGRDAGIHRDIMSRPGGYEYVIEENGGDLSGGQRQRIEIARALADNPSVIILDEATSALDTRTEYEIAKYVHARGVTSILVAHRLSTIRDCDEIVVLERGEVVQRGTHDELVAQDGLYRQLVAAG